MVCLARPAAEGSRARAEETTGVRRKQRLGPVGERGKTAFGSGIGSGAAKRRKDGAVALLDAAVVGRRPTRQRTTRPWMRRALGGTHGGECCGGEKLEGPDTGLKVAGGRRRSYGPATHGIGDDDVRHCGRRRGIEREREGG
jgi:hypothetical protein